MIDLLFTKIVCLVIEFDMVLHGQCITMRELFANFSGGAVPEISNLTTK